MTEEERKELIERVREQNQVAIREAESISKSLEQADEHALNVIEGLRRIRQQLARRAA
jgi:hypothetical protein